jgi:hypothetical protein
MRAIQKIAEQHILNNVIDNILFAEVIPTAREVVEGQLVFLENRLPALPQGDYEVEVKQTLSNIGTTETFNLKHTLKVNFDKNVLTPEDIYNIFPPKNSNSDYHTFLPHLVLNDSLFPWANKLNADTNTTSPSPWIALVLLTEDQFDLSKTVQAGAKITFPTVSLFEEGATALTNDNIRQFAKLTSVLQKKGSNAKEFGEKSILICNSLPTKEKQHTVHVIDLKTLVFEGDHIKATSLFHWEFESGSAKVDIKATLEKASRQHLKLPLIKSNLNKNTSKTEIEAQFQSLLKLLSNEELGKLTAQQNLISAITDKVNTAKEDALNINFNQYLQITLKEKVAKAIDNNKIENSLLRKALWLVINDIFNKKNSINRKDDINTILNQFQYNQQVIEIAIFKIKFRFALMAYFGNNANKTKLIIDKIDKVNGLDIESLGIPITDNFSKLKYYFEQDLKLVAQVIKGFQDSFKQIFSEIQGQDADFTKAIGNIKQQLVGLNDEIQTVTWINPLSDLIKKMGENDYRLTASRPKNFDKIIIDIFLKIFKHKNINALTQSGFSPLPHFMRRGTKVVSMYRSPFVPVAIHPNQNFKAIHFPDELYRFFGFVQMLDATYVAAWELGRMLTLQDEHTATAIYKWKRKYIIEKKTAAQLDPFGLINSPKEIIGNPIFIKTVRPWLTDLSELKNIPFNYLIPYEDMLPPNSIRFFNLDKSWIAALLDGALSVGRIFETEGVNQQEIKWEKFKEMPQGVLGTGCLIRSVVISDYPDLQITANGNLPKMIKKLSSDIVYCLFDAPFTELEIFLKPEGMRFGITNSADFKTMFTTAKSYQVAQKAYIKSPKITIKL